MNVKVKKVDNTYKNNEEQRVLKHCCTIWQMEKLEYLMRQIVVHKIVR